MAAKRLWLPLGGTSRRFVNTKTGETISRRQYDVKYGALKKERLSSYEQKAKKNTAQERAKKFETQAHNLKPLQDKKRGERFSYRHVSIPVEYMGSVDEREINYDKLGVQYQAMISGFKSNPNIYGVATNITYSFGGAFSTRNISTTRRRTSLLPWGLFQEYLDEFISEENYKYLSGYDNAKNFRARSLDFYVIFK
jgi:hypothetical protein